MVAGMHQRIRAVGIAAGMCLLAFPKHHDLLESDGFWMFEPKHPDPLKLAGQEPCASTEHSDRDDEHQHAFGDDPAEGMFEEHKLHPLIAVRPQFAVVWRMQVQERAVFSRDAESEGA